MGIWATLQGNIVISCIMRGLSLSFLQEPCGRKLCPASHKQPRDLIRACQGRGDGCGGISAAEGFSHAWRSMAVLRRPPTLKERPVGGTWWWF